MQEYCNNCSNDWMDTKNRFQPENRFIGDIEDGKRYPFDTYTKAETDEKIAALEAEIASKADESECVDIRARLDALEYEGIKIKQIAITPSTCELGSSNNIDITWQLSKPAVTQNINGMAVAGDSKRFEGVTTDQTYTLNVYDEHTTDSKSVSVAFANQIYYGAAASLDNITSLNKVLSNEKKRRFSATAGAGQYIIYAYPARLGSVTMYVGGFEGGFDDPIEQTVTNNSGYAETYYIYKSANANLGETAVEVKEG